MKTAKEIGALLKNSHTEGNLRHCLSKLSDVIEFEFFLLGVVVPSSGTSAETFVIDNYPEAWREHYKDKQYLQSDPVYHYALSNYLPITWKHLMASAQSTGKHKEIMNHASQHGLNSGFTLPVHGGIGQVGVLNFATASLLKATEDRMLEAMALAQLTMPDLQEAIKRLQISQLKKAAKLLTRREIECLTWVTEGKSSWEISQILGCSEHTAIFHLRNASEKLGAANRYQAISKAWLAGVIQPAFG